MLFLWVRLTSGSEVVDVWEGENVTLSCKFRAEFLIRPDAVAYYWVRETNQHTENVAIKELVLNQNYR